MGEALLAASAATLLECVPFALAAAVLSHRLPPRVSRMVPYLGCGCGTGPSARSIPGALATALLFGPVAALLRLAGAAAAGRALKPRGVCEPHDDAPLLTLFALLPACGGAALVSHVGPAVFGLHAWAPAFAVGVLAGFLAAPCALGAPALAAAIRSASPAAAIGFLCVAGIADVRTFTWRRRSHQHSGHDALAYLLLALGCALTALRGGAQLVHPFFAPPLAACAIVFAIAAYRHRTLRAPRLRIAPAIVLAAVFVSSPPPEYHATETTLGDAFSGERVDFTGIATQTGNATTLVRYAITCCRADAAPIVVRLSKARPALHGWMHARGTLNASLALDVQKLRPVTAPLDPFVYR
ncbi:MAG TPA: hypothetical protein VFL13_05365 [Candidatus Baltobacteraceae bacterium]|nr:hypothetical protein [Candidatus Baltobacteraceae bacterium]